jgi:hypothetical protein
VSQLSTHTAGTPEQYTVRDDPSPYPRPKGHEDKVIDVLSGAEAELTSGRGIGVVLHGNP